jgi:sorbitol-specific phosphotransferase system component IIA
MNKTRVKISQIVENQLPSFVREDFPLATQFLEEYYKSLEFPGSSYDLIQNIDFYTKLDNTTNLVESTILTEKVEFSDDIITVESTLGFPDSYGLIQIDSEIITYKGKDTTHFYDCIRGFSGIESLKDKNNPEQLVFTETEIDIHEILNDDGTNKKVNNLSILFLKEFFRKLKLQFSPGFEDRNFVEELNENIFIKNSNTFYKSKGTEESFRILFVSLYNKEVKVIKPRDYLIQPSDAEYRITKDLVVQALSGDPTQLLNRTLFQDQIGDIQRASGSVTNVQKIQRSGKEYYVLSLDYDFNKDINVFGSVFGNFTIHPKTIITDDVEVNSEVINVDSTVGFPNSGDLIVILDDVEYNITYTSKSLTQFYGCSGIENIIAAGTEICQNVYAYAFLNRETNELITVRITGVLGEFDLIDDAYNFSRDDTVEIISLGINDNSFKFNNWVFNIPMTYQVETPVKIVNGYEITTKDHSNIVTGDNVTLFCITDNYNQQYLTFNVDTVIIPGKKFRIITNQNITYIYNVRKNLNTVPGTVYSSDVQNVYKSPEGDLYVASPSLPNYSNQPLDIRDKTVIFSRSGISTDIIVLQDSNSNPKNHNFLTGDALVYYPASNTNKLNGLSKGVYFVTRTGNNSLKLSSSRENIFKQIYITISGTVTDNKFVPLEFVDSQLIPKELQNQKLIRRLPEPENDGYVYETKPGPVGILANGVEVLNYKSGNAVFYGPIEDISVTSFGSNYDVINPPILEIIDSQTINNVNTTYGYGASGICEVEGSLKRIEIIDPGFDYIKEPKIDISGGNGSGALAKANLFTVTHIVSFQADQQSGHVDLISNTLGFSEYHKFRDYEEVFYDPKDFKVVSGLTTNSTYYVSVQDEYNVKLYETLNDAISGINTVVLSDYGEGNQYIIAKNKKKIVGSVSIIDSGSGYKNRKIQVSPEDVNIYNNTVRARNHRYNNGDIIIYNTNGASISGLSTTTSYIVTKVDEDSFKLSNIGINTTEKDFYYKTKQYIDFNSVGSGVHEFNYPPIQVTISGITGISTVSNFNGNCIIQPIFRGSIKSIFLVDGGSNYGTPDILDYDRKPRFTLNSGSNAQLNPIIINGRISQVLVLNSGTGFNCPPDIKVISGTGIGAVLTPVISNGRLIEVKVINGGFNYNQNDTSIIINPAGKNCNLNFKIKSWNVNLKKKLEICNQISNDDGVITSVPIDEYGLQYTHVYAPKKLRNMIFSSDNENGEILYRADLKNDTENKLYHSPILGWAYDGNPIYGPYGYETIEGNGRVKRLLSGYTLFQNLPDRPNFPDGFFIEDYIFTNSGDLDEKNGRFCRTPEFPNGTYAYFMTLDVNKDPQFPYIIGNYYNSKPIYFNFDINSNQDIIQLQNTNWLRNTTPYNLNGKYSEYEFIFNPNKDRKQLSNINYSSSGKIEEIQIISGGDNYKVNDTLVFDNENTSGINAYAVVSDIEGKPITNIASNYVEITNVEFIPSGNSNKFIAFCKNPHNFNDGDVIQISNIENYRSLQGKYAIENYSTSLVLSQDVQNDTTTGIITDFYVYGGLKYPNISENDIFQIENEKIKILKVDEANSTIKVQRKYDGTLGLPHKSGKLLVELPRKFTFTVNNDSNYDFASNREFYFNPNETLGFGTTVTINNTGIGITQIFIPQGQFYLPNHNLATNQELIYNTNGGIGFFAYNETSLIQVQDNQKLYVAKIDSNFISIANNPIGIGSTGAFVGIGTVNSILYFLTYGIGNNHSIRTNYSNVASGNVSKRDAIITTSENHELQVYDIVDIDCSSGITTTFYVKYDDESRRMIVNPILFYSSDVNISNGSFNIVSHQFKTGEKILHISNFPCGGLSNSGIYYVVVLDENTLQLSESYYDSIQKNPTTIDITSTSSGTFAKVNPELSLYKNNKVIFDVSDSSLSFLDGVQKRPAFDLKFYTDSNFVKEFITTKTTSNFQIQKIGSIGTANARVILNVTDDLPNSLYYKLIPNQNTKNPIEKLEIILDNENITSNNKLNIRNSEYNGIFDIVGITSNTFTVNLRNKPERASYSDGLSYKTSSENAKGKISNIRVKSKGSNYRRLPSVTSIASTTGSGAILIPKSKSVGRIDNKNIVISDLGFEYSCDLTLNPTAKLPDIIKVEPLSSFKRVGILSTGKYYYTPPDLVVIDGYTNQVVNDVILEFGDSLTELVIRKNSNGFYNVTPTIIPINNSNGHKITNVQYNSISGEVTIFINDEFEFFTEHPFNIGDKVLIENIKVNSGKGYNSEIYNYALFEIIDRSPLYLSPYYVKYNLSSYLSSGETPGVYDDIESYGRIIRQADFPIFDPILQKNNFLHGETVRASDSTGIVEYWDPANEILKIQTKDKFNLNDIIKGNTSASRAIISEIRTTNGLYKIQSSSVLRKGWNRETGFLNNSNQRLHDSDYYQYFSYSLKSEVPYEVWDDPVSSLNHTSGFKKFSDLLINSRDPNYSGIQTSHDGGDFNATCDFYSIIDVDCYSDFDLVTENILNINGKLISDELLFNSTQLMDYSEMIGNRVLIIDDISDQFASEAEIKNYVTIDTYPTFGNNGRKYYILIKDISDASKNETVFLDILQDESSILLNQYGKLSTISNIGYFDSVIFDDNVNIYFYPSNTSDSYDISFISYELNNIVTGIGTTNFGDISNFTCGLTTVTPYMTESIIKFPIDYRSCKMLIQYESNGTYEFKEITLIHDGTTVRNIEYAKLNTASDFGDYDIYISGSEVVVNFTSSTTEDVKINSALILTSDSTKTTTGSQLLNNSIHQSTYFSINSSVYPGISTVFSYNNLIYTGSYCIVTVEDLTNNDYQVSEIIIINDNIDAYINEFGLVYTNDKLGDFNVNKNGNTTELYFTPFASIDAQVRIFSSTLKSIDTSDPRYIIRI